MILDPLKALWNAVGLRARHPYRVEWCHLNRRHALCWSVADYARTKREAISRARETRRALAVAVRVWHKPSSTVAWRMFAPVPRPGAR